MLDNALAEVEPAGVSFGIGGFIGGSRGEDVGGAEVGAEFFSDDGPAHEFGDGEEFEELLFGGSEGVAGVGVNAVEEVGLFVVVGGKDDVVSNSLEDLDALVRWGCDGEGKRRRRTAWSCSGLSSTDSVSRTWR